MEYEILSKEEYNALEKFRGKDVEYVDVKVKEQLFRCIINRNHDMIYVPEYFESKIFPLYSRLWSRIKSLFS